MRIALKVQGSPEAAHKPFSGFAMTQPRLNGTGRDVDKSYKCLFHKHSANNLIHRIGQYIVD